MNHGIISIRGVLTTLSLAWAFSCSAQYTDPTRTAAIYYTTSAQKKALTAQQAAQALNTTGHVWLESEMKQIVEFQQEFDKYLNDTHDLLTQAVEVYGLYYETQRMINHLKQMSNVMEEHPTNGLAVALSLKKNHIYQNVVKTCLDIVGDIKEVIYKSRMTEKERFEAVLSIRPKLKRLNKELHRTIRAVKYTSLKDVWYEITERHFRPKTKEEIARQSIREWKRNVGMRG